MKQATRYRVDTIHEKLHKLIRHLDYTEINSEGFILDLEHIITLFEEAYDNFREQQVGSKS